MPEIERVLRETIRRQIQAGALPLTKPVRTWGGPGLDKLCSGCGLPITRDQMEYQAEFEVGGHADLDVRRMHIACFAAWELERELILRAAS